jgi:fluoroquinolone transport system permease protein
MTRLMASTILWDIRLQYRQGLYFAAVFVILLWWFLLSLLPPEARELFLPFAVFMDLSVFGFYFMAGILYLERGERVLEALVVTPMPRYGYLLAKVASLTLLAVVMSSILVLLLYGPGIDWGIFLIGVALNSWLLTLFGFILAARYNGIGDFLIPSMLYAAPSQLPLLYYFDIWDHWLIYLVPTQPTMLLIAGAFQSIAGWQLAYSLAYLLVAGIVLTVWSLRVYERFVVRAEGNR